MLLRNWSLRTSAVMEPVPMSFDQFVQLFRHAMGRAKIIHIHQIVSMKGSGIHGKIVSWE